jgi:hypothetical protein
MNGEPARLEEDDRMPGKAEVGESPERVFYGLHYARIDCELGAEIRREAFDEDFRQESWHFCSRAGRDCRFAAPDIRQSRAGRGLRYRRAVLGPAERWGCFVTGLDIEPEGIAHANAEAARRGFTARVSFAGVQLLFKPGRTYTKGLSG